MYDVILIEFRKNASFRNFLEILYIDKVNLKNISATVIIVKVA